MTTDTSIYYYFLKILDTLVDLGRTKLINVALNNRRSQGKKITQRLIRIIRTVKIAIKLLWVKLYSILIIFQNRMLIIKSILFVTMSEYNGSMLLVK